MDHKVKNSNIGFKYVSRSHLEWMYKPPEPQCLQGDLVTLINPFCGFGEHWFLQVTWKCLSGLTKPLERARERQKSLKFQWFLPIFLCCASEVTLSLCLLALPSWEVIQHLLMHRHTREDLGQECWWQSLLGLNCVAKCTTQWGMCRNKCCSACHSFKSLVKGGNLWFLSHNFWVIVPFLTQLNTFVK